MTAARNSLTEKAERLRLAIVQTLDRVRENSGALAQAVGQRLRMTG
jgi:hypothetical protein